ncbi:malonic semialdehyde reductase [Kutzneria viridogrisea]|uniref:3-hydroxypropanoate dehydrogenase n=2 Tax=Kutzneria TaxID=43356 RepID=A0ABR6BK16_9PSEU|nr:malonic semialdehyde reductase [Kutzneria albida]AHH95413.1 putative NADH dehydrogenase/NAD(P)H nitroreductase [Kutzneria albida DSM 43870]MBA8927228.1 3-hydroxypropanoate dehydrogenase [Kutzneria viridogrisea]
MTAATDILALEQKAQDLLFHEARTANTFTDEPVSDEQVRAIYDLVKWAPTSMNTQPLRVLLVRSEDARAKLLPHMAEGNRAKTGTAPLVAVLAADTDFHETLPKVFPHNPNAKDYFADDAARREFARFNGLLQVGYFILGVRAAGLAAGPMTGFDAEGVRKEFFADTTLEPLVVVNIGRPGPDAWFPRSPRLDYDEAVNSI